MLIVIRHKKHAEYITRDVRNECKKERAYAEIFLIKDCVEDFVFTARNGYRKTQYLTCRTQKYATDHDYNHIRKN
mgnify:CR=1 FL=1